MKQKVNEMGVEVGKGVFSTVIVNTSQNALKKIDMNISSIKNIINETNIIRSCNHPNITKYISSQLLDDRYYGLEMEKAICSLDKWVGKLNISNTQQIRAQKDKQLEEHGVTSNIDLAIDWTIQLCLALNYLKKNHIIHRDIKPTNILLFKQGRVKLCDFGVAIYEDCLRIPQRKRTKDKQLKNVFHVGTPCYMAPQLIKGFHGVANSQLEQSQRSREKMLCNKVYKLPYGFEIDMWSLGVSLYELIWGKFPFKGDIRQIYFESVLNDQPHIPTITNEEYQSVKLYIHCQITSSYQPPPLDKTKRLICGVRMMLEKNKSDRATPQDILILLNPQINQFIDRKTKNRQYSQQ